MNWGEETTVELGAERERLSEKHDRIQEMRADGDNTSAIALNYTANEVSQMGAAVSYLIEGDAGDGGFDGHGADASVTVKGLTSGLYARVTDRVETVRQQRDDIQSSRGIHENIFAAAGLVDAPFVDFDEAAAAVTRHGDDRDYADLDESTKLDARVHAVTQLPPNVTKWLYSLVDDETGVGEGNWKTSTEQQDETHSG